MIVSNGTIYTKGLLLGNDVGARGTVIIEDGQVVVSTNAVSIGNGNGSWGWMSVDHPDGVLDASQGTNQTAQVGGGDLAGGDGYLYVSNGLARFINISVAHGGFGYMEIGAATVTVASTLYIPSIATTADGTGTLVMASADALLEATNAVSIGADANNENVRNAYPRLLMSNGTLRVGEVRLGRRSNGLLYIGAATVTVVRIQDLGFNIGYSTSPNAGTGTLVLAESGSLLDSPMANFRMGVTVDSTALVRMSNGVMNIASLRMGVANRTLSDFWMDDATLNSTGDWQTAAAANTTSRFTMAHVRSLVSITNGSVSLAVKSNSVSTLTVSNGTFRVPLLDIGSATAGDAGPNGNGELRIHAGTVTVELATSTGYGMNLGGRAGNTGVVMLTHSAALLSITNGSRLRLGNSGSAFLIVSGGAARVVGQIRLGESVGSERRDQHLRRRGGFRLAPDHRLLGRGCCESGPSRCPAAGGCRPLDGGHVRRADQWLRQPQHFERHGAIDHARPGAGGVVLQPDRPMPVGGEPAERNAGPERWRHAAGQPHAR
jgi:hypothetical protein